MFLPFRSLAHGRSHMVGLNEHFLGAAKAISAAVWPVLDPTSGAMSIECFDTYFKDRKRGPPRHAVSVIQQMKQVPEHSLW